MKEYYTVKFNGKYSSSAGDRFLDIIYTVEDGGIISCEGTYSYPPSQEQRDQGIYDNNVIACDPATINERAKEINVDLITVVQLGQNKGEFRSGPLGYTWELIE